ncbi:MAG: tRNA pseudouridine(38-40) synthase TruA [Candidatus Omnitrophota bacterium]
MRTESPLTLLWRTVKLIIGFQGTRYEGWQSQKKDSTVQEVFEKALAEILKKKTHLVGSSRTDSGVHALGFAAHFQTKSRLPDVTLKRALNFHLPPDILVKSAKTVRRGFHARFHAKFKVYRYDIWNDETRPLFEAPYVLWHPQPLKVDRMRLAARYLKGKHDFKAFQASGDDRKGGTARTIRRISLTKSRELLRIEIEGDGFLRQMIRIIVGTLLDVGRGKMSPKKVPEILRSKDRRKAGPTAKAHGLTLVRVEY